MPASMFAAQSLAKIYRQCHPTEWARLAQRMSMTWIMLKSASRVEIGTASVSLVVDMDIHVFLAGQAAAPDALQEHHRRRE